MSWYENPLDHPTPYKVTGMISRLAEIGHIGELVFEQQQEVEHFVEYARYLRNWHPRNGYSPSRSMRHIATVPEVVVTMLHQRGLNPAQDPDGFKKWLNSEEARPWRTSSGEV